VTRTAAAALVLAALLAAPSAGAGRLADPGIGDTTITIGGTAPLSGPESAYSVVAAGAAAYFEYVNANGGVNGRKIEYVYYDDAYDPAQTIQQTRRLVEQDKVFAIFNTVGTEHALAIRPYLNQLGVPELFAGSGATALARDARKYPWSLGYLPSFYAEGKLYGRHIAATRPRARVAVLYEDSDFGKDLLAGLQAGLRGSKAAVVARQSYSVTEADVASQLAALKASKGDVLMVFALPKQTIQSFITADKLGWRPQVYVAAVSIDPFVMTVARVNTGNRTTKDALSIAFLKDASNLARWGKDAGVRLYYRIMKAYAPNGDPKAVANFYGMAVAYTMVDALRRAGKDPTRRSLLEAATHLNETNPFLLPGITVRTTPTDRYPIEQAQLYRYQGGVWRTVGPLIPARP
jgi:ABC-type branched-subunit amino acid transport system substrate-binding protein